MNKHIRIALFERALITSLDHNELCYYYSNDVWLLIKLLMI